MSAETLNRWGAMATIATALLLLAAAVAMLVVPEGGLASPIPSALYYLALVLAVPAYMTIYLNQSRTAGKLGFAGFAMSVIGSILYSGPAFVLLAGTSGVATWHDLWGFAMGNVLPLGASLFLIGSTMLGVASIRANVFPRNAGRLLTIGSVLWLIVFYIPIPFMLSLANLLNAVAFFRMGVTILPRAQEEKVQARQAV